MTDRDDQLALYKEALRAATEAFAEYALDTAKPSPAAVDGLVDGFIQEANTRIVFKRHQADPPEGDPAP